MAVLFTDVTGDRSARRERAAYTSALEDLNERLTLVAEITDVLGQTLETDDALARLGRLLVPRLADWAAVDLRTGSGQVHRMAVTGPAGRDAGLEGGRERLPETGEADRSPLGQVLNGGEPVLQDQQDDTQTAAPPGSPLAATHSDFLRTVGATSAITVPLGARRQITGALTLVRTDPAHPFDADDLAVVSDIGRRVGLVIDNARRFGRQRAVAEAMQRNLLAPLPQPGRLRLAARYQPAPAGSQVGGDWYDAFELKDGTLALVIGDVVGHDLTAAAGMAQLHGILRSLAWDHTGPPGAVVDRLDDAMPAITTVPMATLVLAQVEGHPHTGPWTLRWTSAGHPPPLLLTPDGHAHYLEAGQGLVLGAPLVTGTSRPDATQSLPPASTLLLYTDGLIESPGSDLDHRPGPTASPRPRPRPRTAGDAVRPTAHPYATRQHRRRGPARPASAGPVTSEFTRDRFSAGGVVDAQAKKQWAVASQAAVDVRRALDPAYVPLGRSAAPPDGPSAHRVGGGRKLRGRGAAGEAETGRRARPARLPCRARRPRRPP